MRSHRQRKMRWGHALLALVVVLALGAPAAASPRLPTASAVPDRVADLDAGPSPDLLAQVPVARRRVEPTVGATAPVVARETGLSTSTRTTYRLAPAGGAVSVTVQLTLTNRQPDMVGGGYVRQSYVDRYSMLVLGEAEGLAASRDGTRLAVALRPRAGSPTADATIDLVPDLFYGDTQTIEISYRLPPRPPRGEGFSRVNAAYVTFPAFAAGDPGAADIEVIVPNGFEAEIVGDPMAATVEGDVTVFRALDIADPDTFLANVVARDDDALVRVPVTFEEHSLTVLGWPGDDEWATFVADKVARGVPVLEDLVGLAWPGKDDLQVIETASPYLYGYGGWYLPSQSLVEIGDALAPEVILHELSHLWFNQDLFAERWINEGFADVYAGLAMERLGEDPVPLLPVGPADPGRISLLDWSDPDLKAPISEAQETYGYNASRAVLDGIAEEIGLEALSKVVVAADSRVIAYPGDGDPVRYSTAPGWQQLLDLLEGVGGSTSAADAFAALVIPEVLRPTLEDRTLGRARYDELTRAADGWSAPRGLRMAMARWRFGEAAPFFDAAQEVLDVRTDVTRTLAPSGVPVPAALEDGFEGAVDVDDLEATAEGALEASTSVATAVLAERDAKGPLAILGTLGGDADRRLADARTALDEGEYETARDDAEAATDAYDGATKDGALRLAGLLGLLAGITVLLRRRRRALSRRRHARAGEHSDVVLAPTDVGRTDPLG